MLNSDNIDINYQHSNSNCEIRFFDRGSFDCNYSSFSWHKALSRVTDVDTSCSSKGNSFKSDPKECSSSIYDLKNKSKIDKKFSDERTLTTFRDSVMDLIIKPRSILKPPRFAKPKITTKHIKAIMHKDILNKLSPEVQQHLISLMPACDQIRSSDQSANDIRISLSATAMDNDFFNRALVRYLLKMMTGKSILSKGSVLRRFKKESTTKVSLIQSPANVLFSDPGVLEKCDSSSTIRLDYDINVAKVDCNFEVESPLFDPKNVGVNHCDIKKENEVEMENDFVDGSDYSDIVNIPEYDSVQNKLLPHLLLSNSACQSTLSSSTDVVIAPRNGGKYKRRNTNNSIILTPCTRPARSTAGKLPARLMSSSPQPGTQGTIVSNLPYRSQSPKAISKSQPGRKKNKEKRKYTTTEHNNNSDHSNGLVEHKPVTFHNDTILLNLRTKLSKRIQKNSQKDYSDNYSIAESNVNSRSDVNCFNSKSPISLSPESDKIHFVDSPIAKNNQNNFRQLKFRNQYFENQTPTSPQWSFSSEFTSQSSVESVLSQKNIKVDLEEVVMPETLLDDMGTEEMPPPRRTLTVAAMREKMRAKKMAKEEKRKDFDKDFPFDVERLEDENKGVDLLDRHCQSSTMSNMMVMCQDHDNDNDNIANEFDSFLLDDYHGEMDDKMLSYPDDLDDLLLSGGNESLLEIILKDPDAMEIGNDSFGNLGSDRQARNPMVGSDQAKCLFSNAHMQSHCPAFTNTTTADSHVSDCSTTSAPSLPASSLCRIDNSILSQALTSVIQKSDSSSNVKDSNALKSALQNAYLVDGNGLSDALRLIQSLHPSAKVTTQQFYLVNSGPQLVLSQAPPAQSVPLRPVSAQTPIKSAPATANAVPTTHISTPIVTSAPQRNDRAIASSKPLPVCTQSTIMSSSVPLLSQFSAFNPKSSNLYSLNSSLANGTSINCQLNSNTQPTMSTCPQQSPIFGTQKSIALSQTPQNTFGIRLQLAQNFSNSQQLNIIQPSQTQMIPTLMNQPLQFLSAPQNNNNNNGNISLITQSQPMSKLVFLYPNLNCSTQISNDIGNSLKADQQQQQLILLSQPSSDQLTPISLSTTPTFQVLNGPNFWQQINPNINTLLSSQNANNLVLMNPQTLNNQSFAFNYHQPSPLITTTGSNLLMMSATQGPKINQPNKAASTSTSSLSFSLSKTEDSPLTPVSNMKNTYHNNAITSITNNYHNNRITSTSTNNNYLKPINSVNSNSSQNSCIEQLSNSSSSANSKLSFDEKLSKSLSGENLTDSDQEKSINSPQFPLLNGHDLLDPNQKLLSPNRYVHLTVDIDSTSSPNCYYQTNNATIANNISSNNSHRDDPELDYDQSDFEIPCLYSNTISGKRIGDEMDI